MKPATWRPYIAGALIGVLAILSVLISTKTLDKPKYLGASTSFVRAAGLIEEKIAPEHVEANAYYQSKKVKVDWQLMVLAGILVGAFVSSMADRSFRTEAVPPVWSDRFGNSVPLRAIGAFGGGVVAMFGARLAGGCPSGHGLSGLMQMSISGFLVLAGMFAGGILVAKIVYRNGRQ